MHEQEPPAVPRGSFTSYSNQPSPARVFISTRQPCRRRPSWIRHRVARPVAAYFRGKGRNLQGTGVVPDIEERISPESLWNGNDNQLDRALRLRCENRGIEPISTRDG